MKLGDLQLSPRHLINGRWEIGTTTGISTNPSDTREVVAEYARADRNQTELAATRMSRSSGRRGRTRSMSAGSTRRCWGRGGRARPGRRIKGCWRICGW